LAVQPQDRYPSAGAFLEAALTAVDGTEYAFRGPVSSQPMLHLPQSDASPLANTVVAPPVGRAEAPSRNSTVVAAVKPTEAPKRGGIVTTLLALVIVAVSGVAVFAA